MTFGDFFRTSEQIAARKKAKRAAREKAREEEEAYLALKYADKIADDEQRRKNYRNLIEAHRRDHPGEPFNMGKAGDYAGGSKQSRKKSRARKTRRKTYRRQ